MGRPEVIILILRITDSDTFEVRLFGIMAETVRLRRARCAPGPGTLGRQGVMPRGPIVCRVRAGSWTRKELGGRMGVFLPGTKSFCRAVEPAENRPPNGHQPAIKRSSTGIQAVFKRYSSGSFRALTGPIFIPQKRTASAESARTCQIRPTRVSRLSRASAPGPRFRTSICGKCFRQRSGPWFPRRSASRAGPGCPTRWQR